MKYYTYAWLREDKTPYYIGKGTGRRAYKSHYRAENNGLIPPPKNRIIFLKTNLTEEEAFLHEEYMIFLFGLKSKGGMLINLTLGGTGGKGRKYVWWNNGERNTQAIECPGENWTRGRINYKNPMHHESAKKKISEGRMGIKFSKETCEKMSLSRRGRRWWNNGEKTKLCYECPGDGWVLGRPGHLIN